MPPTTGRTTRGTERPGTQHRHNNDKRTHFSPFDPLDTPSMSTHTPSMAVSLFLFLLMAGLLCKSYAKISKTMSNDSSSAAKKL